MSYGLELRERVIEFVLEGKIMQEAHKTFKVHYNMISKWLNRYWEEGHLNPKEAYRQAPAGGRAVSKREKSMNIMELIC